jgi:type III secretion system FlhB-like substrate exporter
MTNTEEYQQALDYVKELGYNNISEYVADMAEEYGVPVESARWLYSCLGHLECADGFISALGDYVESRAED